MQKGAQPVDAVITWVDGGDPVHRAKREKWHDGAGNSPAAHVKATDATRFDEQGEIRWCIASLLQNAPFLRCIWIVTDAQRPAVVDDMIRAGICDASRLRIVDHRDMFGEYAACLPTFASSSIEAMLWNIEGLAENYIFLNDDFYLNGPCDRRTFFTDDGLPVVRGAMRSHKLRHRLLGLRAILSDRFGFLSAPSPGFELAQSKGARLAGASNTYVRTYHSPRPMRRSTLRDFYAKHPDVLVEQLEHRFRHHSRHNAITLGNMIEIMQYGAPFVGPPDMVYLHPKSFLDAADGLRQLSDDGPLFGCIQSLDQLPPETVAQIKGYLDEKFAGYLPLALGKSES